MPSVFIAVPVLGNPCLEMSNSLYSQMHGCGLSCRLYFMQQESLIPRARNACVHEFMHSGETHMLFWDADIECAGTVHGKNAVRQLVDSGKDLIGGLYALKADEDGKCSSVVLKQPLVLDGGIVPMKWLSTGFFMVTKECMAKVWDAHPELEYDGDGHMQGKVLRGVFNPMIYVQENGQRKLLSEDWTFCQRWIDLGGEVFADTSIILNHWGKKPYRLWVAKT